MTLHFEEMLSLIEDRSAVLRGAAAAAPAGAQVPGCPDWQVSDLVTHLGEVQRWWAAVIAAGPATDCWTWWMESSAPSTSGAVARHQVQEAAVHARDAQETAGHAGPLPETVAVDGVSEFLTTCLGACGPWKLAPAQVALQASEGPSWLLDLSEKGAVVIPGEPAGTPPTVAATGTASDLVLALYGRVGLDTLRLSGDRAVLGQLIDWGPRD